MDMYIILIILFMLFKLSEVSHIGHVLPDQDLYYLIMLVNL